MRALIKLDPVATASIKKITPIVTAKVVMKVTKRLISEANCVSAEGKEKETGCHA